MSLTSLGIASDGLLDRGGSPALHIGVRGLLRAAAASVGGGIASGVSRLSTLIRREEEEILAIVAAAIRVMR